MDSSPVRPDTWHPDLIAIRSCIVQSEKFFDFFFFSLFLTQVWVPTHDMVSSASASGWCSPNMACVGLHWENMTLNILTWGTGQCSSISSAL